MRPEQLHQRSSASVKTVRVLSSKGCEGPLLGAPALLSLWGTIPLRGSLLVWSGSGLRVGVVQGKMFPTLFHVAILWI